MKLKQEKEEQQTTIRLRKKTRDKLDLLGTRHDSYDLILNRLFDNYFEHLIAIEKMANTFPNAEHAEWQTIPAFLKLLVKIASHGRDQLAAYRRWQLEKEVKG